MAYKSQGDDYDTMNLLVNCSKNIWGIMQKLGKLDADRQNGTTLYNHILEELKCALEIESNCYQSLDDYEKIEAMRDYFISIFQNEEDNPLEVAITKSDLVGERVIQKLDGLLPSEYKAMKNAITIVTKDLQFSIVPTDFSAIEIQKSFFRDQCMCFLAILESYQSFQEIFSMMKYKLACISSDLEKQLLQTGFQIPNKVYLNTYCIGQLNGQNVTSIEQFQKFYAQDMVFNELQSLLNYSDDVLSVKRAEVILKLCVFRTGLLFITEQDVTEIMNYFQNLIRSVDSNVWNDSKTIIKMIENAFNQYEEDRRIPISVQLKKM